MIDTTPTIYPRPDDASVLEGMSAAFYVVQNIEPGLGFIASDLIRYMLPRGISVAQAMWGIHELTVQGGFEAHGKQDARQQGRDLIRETPAGLTAATGHLHLGHEWVKLAFMPDQKKLAELRFIGPKSDLKSDKPERKKRRRPMNAAAAGCARLFKKAKRYDPTTKMTHVVAEYVEKHGGSAETITRILNDNPDQWKI